MSLDKEFGDINKTQVVKYIDTPGIHAIMVQSVLPSEKKQGYTGKPFFEFSVVTIDDNRISRITFYRSTPEDTPESADFKKKRIKEFINNLGISMDGKSAEQILIECKGKTLNALFRRSEKLGYDKNNLKKPIIKEVIEYSFSKPITEQMSGNASYLHSELSAKDRQRFEHEHAAWMKENGGAPSTTSTGSQNDKSFEESLKKLPSSVDDEDLE